MPAQNDQRPTHPTRQASPLSSAPLTPPLPSHPRNHDRTSRRRRELQLIKTILISTKLARRHLLVAVMRMCALLVFLISSPLLYCFSTQVVASCLVTTISTIAFFGLINKQHHSPSFPFDPSPPIVLHIINRTTFPPKYSSRCTTYCIRPLQPPTKQTIPDPIVLWEAVVV